MTQAAPIRKPAGNLPPPPAQVARRKIAFGKIATATGHRILLYGPGGIGKTTLAAQLPGPVAFIDLDESLPRLKRQFDAAGIGGNVVPVEGVGDWQSLREALQSEGWECVRSLVIDTATRAEEMAIAHTLATVKGGDNKTPYTCGRIEDYGYGKGYQHVFDTFLPLLADLDRHCREGRNVVLVCHDCTSTVPNPAGEDWMRYEPRLQSPNSGKASIRLRVREWADHVLFVGYDVSVGKDGKGRGAGTRTLYTAELPHCMAKSRSTQEAIPVEGDGSAVWEKIVGEGR